MLHEKFLNAYFFIYGMGNKNVHVLKAKVWLVVTNLGSDFIYWRWTIEWQKPLSPILMCPYH